MGHSDPQLNLYHHFYTCADLRGCSVIAKQVTFVVDGVLNEFIDRNFGFYLGSSYDSRSMLIVYNIINMKGTTNSQTSSSEDATQSEKSQYPLIGAEIEVINAIGEKIKENSNEMDQILSHSGSRMNDNTSKTSNRRSHMMINEIEFKACTIPSLGKNFE